MRKYLWAVALFGAAGMAIPGWAQERSRSFFGLGKPKQTAQAEEKKADKPARLKNYNDELFGAEDQPAPASASAAKAAPKAPVAESAEAPAAKKSSSLADVLGEKPAPTAGKPSKEVMDDLDAEDAAEELAEAAEEQDLMEKAAAKAAAREPLSNRVMVQTARKPKTPVKSSEGSSGSAERPAWAQESIDVATEEFQPIAEQSAAPVDSASEEMEQEEAPRSEQVEIAEQPKTEEAVEAEAAEEVAEAAPPVKKPVVSKLAAKTPAKPSPRTEAAKPLTSSRLTEKTASSKTYIAKSTVSKPTSSRLNTPIQVAADPEETTGSEITPASAAETTPEKDIAKPAARGSVSISRQSAGRPARSSETVKTAVGNSEAASAIYSSKSGPATAQSPTVTVEWRAGGAINVGQESTCDLVVKNSGSVIAKKVEVEANFPANGRLVSSDPQPASESSLVWQFEEIEPGDEKIVKVKFIPVERGEVAASANVRFTGAASTSFAVTEPMLALKIEGSSEVMVGEVTSQTLMINNPGTGTAANVRVEAILPPGLVHAKGDRLAMDLGNLAPGESRPVRLALTAEVGGRQVIEVHATADSGLVQSASTEVTVIAPSLKSSIEGPGLRYLGRQATYKLHVENDGPVATDNVRVMHKVPEGFDFVSAEKGAQYDSQNRMLNWFVGRLDKGEKAEVSVVMTAKTAGEFTHYIRATSEHGAVSDADTATRVEGAASLVVNVADLDDPVEVGVETGYEVTVKNDGTAPASNVSLTCELPAGVEFLSANGPASYVNEKELVVFKSVDAIAPGKSIKFQVKVKGTLSGNMRFRTKLTSDSIAEPLTSEELTKVYGE